ncbi:putative RNA-binding Zn ribbon-like protein [Chitinophaga polysaccharea]|uniref:Putative RNA-binding Zn ribbon-like protein n=1 Tax=Chitinophaga polysaccharea TaxID=1293035 RepID=A0A561P708_9BACT|nr:CGNR zinc finger domain-containing protein [Chitinophaga polysaccharea]TWF33871.1 putative RNA-binding Zn ribbon-like protein [Chitinophaga polysaccharea]
MDLDKLQLDGGCLVFDFINTINNRNKNPHIDYLSNYESFLLWSCKVKITRKSRVQALLEHARQGTEKKSEAFDEIIRCRENLHDFFYAIISGKAPAAHLIESFNALLSFSMRHLSIKIKNGALETNIESKMVSLREPLWYIGKSAYEVLQTNDWARFKSCPSCGWLFIDTSKSATRKWCNMKVCGGQDKARKYYHREKSKKA